MRKLIGIDDDSFDKLTQLGRDRMATLQELADEAFADLLRKHGVPIDLRDALRKSAGSKPVKGASERAVDTTPVGSDAQPRNPAPARKRRQAKHGQGQRRQAKRRQGNIHA